MTAASTRNRLHETISRVHYDGCGCVVPPQGATQSNVDEDWYVLLTLAVLEDTQARCQAEISLHHWRLWIDADPILCLRPASGMVTFTCPEHGMIRDPICQRHLSLLREGVVIICCVTCGRPGVWSDL